MSENGLWVIGAIEIDALVVFIAGEAHRVGTIEHHVASLGMRTDEIEGCCEAHTLPLADAAPPLDTVVPRDLRPRR
jgi:hypothetical protein